MKGTWVTALNKHSVLWPTCALTDPLGTGFPSYPVTKGTGQSCFSAGVPQSLLCGQGWTGNLLQKTEGHLHEMSAKPLRCLIWIGFHIRLLDRILLSFHPDVLENCRELDEPGQAHRAEGLWYFLVSCRGRSSSDFLHHTAQPTLRGRPVPGSLPPSLLNHIWTLPSP